MTSRHPVGNPINPPDPKCFNQVLSKVNTKMSEMTLKKSRKEKSKQFLSRKKLNNVVEVLDAIKTGNYVVNDE